MDYKAVIFDMDGTIVDTEKIWYKANLVLLESKGVTLPPDVLKNLLNRIHGLGIRKACQAIKEVAELSDPLEQLVEEKSHIALKLYENGIDFIEGFEEFHNMLSAPHLNLKTAVATNADDVTIHITKKTLNLEKFFGQHIYGISAVDNVCKPDPAIYLHAAKRLGIDPADCIAIEDSAHGIRAAKAAGMYCIGINTSNLRGEIAHADRKVSSYKELHPHKLRHKK